MMQNKGLRYAFVEIYHNHTFAVTEMVTNSPELKDNRASKD